MSRTNRPKSQIAKTANKLRALVPKNRRPRRVSLAAGDIAAVEFATGMMMSVSEAVLAGELNPTTANAVSLAMGKAAKLCDVQAHYHKHMRVVHTEKPK